MSDELIRIAAFEHLAKLQKIYGDCVPNAVLREGFDFAGENVRLENQAQGIFKPRQMLHGALSIKTTMPRNGVHVYSDRANDDGTYRYSFEAGDPRGSRNKLLWQSYEFQLPFVYLYAVAPAVYSAIWPCFIADMELSPSGNYAVVVVGEKANDVTNRDNIYKHVPSLIESRYAVRETQVRLHQASFREQVLNAYGRKCAVTAMKQDKLIEAAHIVSDREIGEHQYINNGIALSRVHHKAFDSQLMGITPDYEIKINHELMGDLDNRFIEEAFLKQHGRKIAMPRQKSLRPNREFLEQRYIKFCQV